MAATQTLNERFNGSGIPATFVDYADAGFSVTVTGGYLNLTSATSGPAACGLESLADYEFVNTFAMCEIPDVAGISGQLMTLSSPYIYKSGDDTYAVYWRVDNDGLIRAVKRIAGVETSLGSVSVGASAQFLMVQNDNGTIRYLYSATGIPGSWTEAANVAASSLGFDMGDVKQGCQLFVSGAVSATTVKIRNWNITGIPVGWTVG